MFKRKNPVTEAEIQPIWKYLVSMERRLGRNKLLYRILHPVGCVIFFFNLLLVTGNLYLYIGGDLIRPYFEKLPILPALVEGLPRSSKTGIFVFSLCFTFLIPLAINGAIFGLTYYLEERKHKKEVDPLQGNKIECARALVYQAERVYALRKKIPSWSVYWLAAILSTIATVPALQIFVSLAKEEAPAPFLIALSCMAILLGIFVLYWVYALLFRVFAYLNDLFTMSPSAWKLWELYHRLDAYWLEVDPSDQAHRDEKKKEKS